MKPKGAVAAGSRATARAAVEIFERGGNAVDAAVAACFATSAGEPVLTSLAGGGVMLVRCGRTGEVTALDFFANAPGLEVDRTVALDFHPVEIDFGPATQQFHAGAGSAAVPGVIPGLFQALERWGRMEPADVLAPACRMLDRGEPLGGWQADTVRLFQPFLARDPAVRARFLPDGKPPPEGYPFRLPQLADFLGRLTRGDWKRVYRDEVWSGIEDRFGPTRGGRITRRDLEAYEPEMRRPLSVEYRGNTVHLNPPPSAGGWMVGLMLRVLETEPPPSPAHGFGEARVHALTRAMAATDEARAQGRGADALADPFPWQRRFRERAGLPLGAAPRTNGGPSSTTHISTVDGDGNAAAVTFSFGEGCGGFIGDTGILMNNLMGEADLFPGGFHRWPAGERLSTMMCPTFIESSDGSFTVLGTGGANRIRSAIVQVVTNLLDLGLGPAPAVARPRIHFEAGVLSAETHDHPGGSSFLDGLGAARVVRFPEPNLFFGGVHMVRRTRAGEIQGTGDRRRQGVCRVVG